MEKEKVIMILRLGEEVWQRLDSLLQPGTGMNRINAPIINALNLSPETSDSFVSKFVYPVVKFPYCGSRAWLAAGKL